MSNKKIPSAIQWEMTKYFQKNKWVGFNEIKLSLLGVKRLAKLCVQYTGLKFSPDLPAHTVVLSAYDNLKAENKIDYFFKDRSKFYSKSRKKKDLFFLSSHWQQLRYRALVLHGRRCMCCGATPDDGIVLHVDHIKPRSKYPELELDISNLQILCRDCNLGKSNIYEHDFRKSL